MSSFCCFWCSCQTAPLFYNKRSSSFFMIGRSLPLNHSPCEWFSLDKKQPPCLGGCFLLCQGSGKPGLGDIQGQVQPVLFTGLYDLFSGADLGIGIHQLYRYLIGYLKISHLFLGFYIDIYPSYCHNKWYRPSVPGAFPYKWESCFFPASPLAPLSARSKNHRAFLHQIPRYSPK